MQGWSKGIIYSAVGLTGVGLLLIALAWNGAASLDYAQGQIPYLLSGGAGGLALVIAGIALMTVYSLRRDLLLLGRKLDRMAQALEADPAQGSPAAAAGQTGQVVAGRTTYHTPHCHLVEDRDDLQTMEPETAHNQGLAPCRICNPAEVPQLA